MSEQQLQVEEYKVLVTLRLRPVEGGEVTLTSRERAELVEKSVCFRLRKPKEHPIEDVLLELVDARVMGHPAASREAIEARIHGLRSHRRILVDTLDRLLSAGDARPEQTQPIEIQLKDLQKELEELLHQWESLPPKELVYRTQTQPPW